MLSVARQYKKAFQPVFAEYGFQSYKNAFYRVINDVVQIFCLHRYRDGMCTFFFDIEPVALGLSELDTITYNIVALRDAPFEGRDWYPAELIDTNFSEAIQLTQKYVLPFFEKGIDAGSAYQVICDYEQRIYRQELIMLSWVKFLFCLQAKSYARAAQYMEVITKYSTEAIMSLLAWRKQHFGPLSKEEIEAEEAKILLNQQKLEKVRNWDTDYWDEVLKTGTAKTMSFLSTIQSGKGSKSRRKGTV